MASFTRSVSLFSVLAALACLAMAAPATDNAVATATTDVSYSEVTATSSYNEEGLPSSIFPVLTGYADEYESTTELDDGILYMSEQDEGTKF
ncbi:hypothetical protein INT46_005126 [Mucor plumbeus]|uniref:Uncharacterized protein n=1 Tax=Mucor plumbeus TaxID=97098 RepID=A0A8H7VD76_9FUNG|nr:hypothetical protein INT46_005126 [Mucor plumbeus]